MLKKGLFIVAAVAMLAMSAQAGEIKFHVWPCTYTAMPVCTLKVTMDVGYWISFKSQSKVIKLTQSATDIHQYDGCYAYTFACNFPVILSASIAKYPLPGGGTLGGTFSVDLSQAMWPAGTANVVNVCAHVSGLDLSAISGGTKDIQVGTVTISVVPQT